MTGSGANAQSLELTSLGPEPNDAVVASSKYGDEPAQLAVTTNGGTSWSSVGDPCSHDWVGLTALTQSADAKIALLCFGGAAAGSGTRGFYVSTNRGRSWVLRAADDNAQRRRIVMGQLRQDKPVLRDALHPGADV